MKFKDKYTFEILTVDEAMEKWCGGCKGNECAINSLAEQKEMSGRECKLWIVEHMKKAGEIMGFDVVEDDEKLDYWDRVTVIAQRQREKGLNKYGMKLEDNDWPIEKRLEYLEEELIDGLMYIEWIKEGLRK